MAIINLKAIKTGLISSKTKSMEISEIIIFMPRRATLGTTLGSMIGINLLILNTSLMNLVFAMHDPTKYNKPRFNSEPYQNGSVESMQRIASFGIRHLMLRFVASPIKLQK